MAAACLLTTASAQTEKQLAACPTLTLSPSGASPGTALQSPRAGQPYSATITVSGASTDYFWQFGAGVLPPGFDWNPKGWGGSTLTISGTPNGGPGFYNFGFHVYSDAGGHTTCFPPVSGTYDLNIFSSQFQGSLQNTGQAPPNDCPVCAARDEGDPVSLRSGHVVQHAVDLRIAGRGFDYSFERSYDSGSHFVGPLGYGWDFNYDRRLIVVNSNSLADAKVQFPAAKTGDVERLNSGAGRADIYAVNPDGSYLAPAGFFATLVKNPDGTFIERAPSGVAYAYGVADSISGIAPMVSMSDRNGNTMSFQYNAAGQLATVVDTLGRQVTYSYNTNGMLQSVTDFTGRSVKFSYDLAYYLVSVTSPAIIGTPNGNDFPSGRTTQYSSYENVTGPLNGALLTILSPNQVAAGATSTAARTQFTYQTSSSSPDYARVISQKDGGPSGGLPSGGTLTYGYLALSGNPSDPNAAVAQTIVTDRNGNQTIYQFDSFGSILLKQLMFNRHVDPTNPVEADTRFTYDTDDRLLSRTDPAGNVTNYGYDSSNPDRHQQGNLLSTTRIPDATRGGDQTQIKTTFTYEPIFGQLRSQTDPRGNDPSYVPQNGGPNSPARYTTTNTFDYEEACDFAAIGARIGASAAQAQALLSAAGMCAVPLGDVNGDGVTNQFAGNVIRVVQPTVHLLPACPSAQMTQANVNCSQQARLEGTSNQPVVRLSQFNLFGQVTAQIDPEANVTTYVYYSEQDPNGDGTIENPSGNPTTGGYLKLRAADATANAVRDSKTNPAPVAIRNLFGYDEVGHETKLVDGRGIETDYAVNQVGEVVQTSRAVAHGVFAPDPPEPLSLTDFAYLERSFYDFDGNLVVHQVEDRGNTSSVDGNPPAADLPPVAPNPDPAGGPAFADTVYKYDLLDRRTDQVQEVTNGAKPLFLYTHYRYDPNGNQVLSILPAGNATSRIYDERDALYQSVAGATSPPLLAQLASTDPINYAVRGGAAATTTSHHDANGNMVEVDSPLGHRNRFIFDGFDRQTSAVDGVGDQAVTQYDPAGNTVRVANFGPVGGPSPTSPGPDPLLRPVSSGGVLQPAKLISTTLLSATASRYDELSRRYETDQGLFVKSQPTLRPVDVATGGTGLGPGKLNLDPTDTCAVPGLPGPASRWLGCVASRVEFDRSSRSMFSIADDGGVFSRLYDGAGRLVSSTDPIGNNTQAAFDDNGNLIETQRTDVATVASVPSEVFLTTSFYDGLNRLQEVVDNLGQTVQYRYDSRGDLVAKADGNGPAGPTISRRVFAAGAKTVNVTNLFGNVTINRYDGLGRQLQSRQVLTASGLGDGAHIGATIFGTPDVLPTPDTTQGGGDGLITIGHTWDSDSLLAAAVDDNGNQTSYTYDDLNRRLTEKKGVCVPPKLANRCDTPTTIKSAYDLDSNLLKTTEETGSVLVRSYDLADRLTAVKVTPGAGVAGSTKQAFQFDGLSRLTSATDNNAATTTDDSTVTFSYDSLGRTTEERQRIGSLAAVATDTAWRAAGLRSMLTYPNGRVLVYSYDGLDRLASVADQGVPTPIATYDFIGDRVLVRAAPPNGTRTTYLDNTGTVDSGYDGAGRPVESRSLRADNSTVVGFDYTYDRAGRPLSERKLHDAADSELYSYDSAGRLLQFQRGTLNSSATGIVTPSTNVPLQSMFALDGAGNWKQVDAEARLHGSFDEVYQRTGSSTVTLAFDANGNTTDQGSYTYSYDAFNRLTTVTRKADGLLVATYTYDALGRRISKAVTNDGVLNGTTFFYSDRAREIEERNGSNAITQQYVFGRGVDEPLALDRNGAGRLSYAQNPLGSTEALTDTAGKVVEGYLYDAYGRQWVVGPGLDGTVEWGGDDTFAASGTSALSNPLLLTGRRFDPETGLYYYRARYLDTTLGRFLSRDPIGVWADRTNLGNGYTYVGGRPTVHVDPSGWEEWSAEGERRAVLDAQHAAEREEVLPTLFGGFTAFPLLISMFNEHEAAAREEAVKQYREATGYCDYTPFMHQMPKAQPVPKPDLFWSADQFENLHLAAPLTGENWDTGVYDDGHTFGWNTKASGSGVWAFMNNMAATMKLTIPTSSCDHVTGACTTYSPSACDRVTGACTTSSPSACPCEAPAANASPTGAEMNSGASRSGSSTTVTWVDIPPPPSFDEVQAASAITIGPDTTPGLYIDTAPRIGQQ